MSVGVSIILVNYFSNAHTQRCLESIYERTQKTDFEVIVVDNHSDLETEPLKRRWPNLRVFQADRNLGLGVAFDFAAARASGDCLFFLNNDCLLRNDAASLLRDFLNEHADAGLVSPQLFDREGRRAVSFDYFPTLTSKFLGTDLLRLLYPKQYPDRHALVSSALEVPLVSGAALFVRASCYRAIGGFDPRFFLYCEEEDLAMRVRAHGWKVYLVPAAEVQHVGGGSSAHPVELRREFYVSFLKLYQKHYGRMKTKVLFLICLGQAATRYLTKSAERPLWAAVIRWLLRGAPERESLRYAPGNLDDAALRESDWRLGVREWN